MISYDNEAEEFVPNSENIILADYFIKQPRMNEKNEIFNITEQPNEFENELTEKLKQFKPTRKKSQCKIIK